jgi:predicted  nucleic acid-binding Zn-ribbon protein
MATRRQEGGSGNEGVRILRAIWNEMKALNARVDQTNARLDQTNIKLDAVRTELRDEINGLRRRVVESEVRLATATAQLSSDVQALTGLIREWREEHRGDRAEMKARIARLEEHVGLSPAGR